MDAGDRIGKLAESLPSLVTDLLATEHLDFPSCYSASRTSRTWRAHFQRHLYTYINLSSTSRAIKLLIFLAGDGGKKMRECVKAFHIGGIVYEGGNPQKLDRGVNLYIEERIHRLCNLQMHFKSDVPPQGIPMPFTEQLGGVDFGSLTTMKLSMNCSFMYNEENSFLRFPRLRCLLLLFWDMGKCNDESQDWPVWFDMPKLLYLVLQHFKTPKGKFFSLPKESQYIRTIELLKGDYSEASDFFGEDGPLKSCASTLESLTITTREINSHAGWSLDHLRALAKLCIPSVTFDRAGGPPILPPQLRTLVVFGYPHDTQGDYEDTGIFMEIGRRRFIPDLEQILQQQIPLQKFWVLQPSGWQATLPKLEGIYVKKYHGEKGYIA